MTDWVQQAQHLTDEVLRPASTEVDGSGMIPQSHFETLRDQGFYGLAFASTDPVSTLAESARSSSVGAWRPHSSGHSTTGPCSG